MCGIVGYHGNEEAAEKVFEGLKKLEYRGYDSAGIATVGNPSIKLQKGTGTIDVAAPDNAKLDGSIGIGHTRWATHGGVTDQNAHPHTDCNEEVAVVHNGIINNYHELKEELQDHNWGSETDTEVIPHLIEEHLNELGLRKAVEKTVDKLRGSYAFVAVTKTGEMVAYRDGSPLVIGVREEERFLASDVTPFLEYTSQAVFIEDGDLVEIDGSHTVYRNGEVVERETTHIDWDAEQASKEGHDHFMKKEIEEQPTTVKKAAFQDKTDIEKAVEMIREADKVYLTGCGTSSFAASLGGRFLREQGIDVDVEQSHELEHRAEHIGEDDLVLAISQSGETADLMAVLDKSPAKLLAIVNVVGSSIDRRSDHTIYTNAGPEIGVASTKAFTGQVTVLKLLQYALQDELEEGRRSLLDTAEKLGDLIEDNQDTLEEIADYISDKEHVYFIGRSNGYDIARESALKLKELSYIHAESFPGGEFKHGTLALVDEGTPVVTFLDDRSFDDTLSNAIEAKSRGADLIGCGMKEVDGFEHFVELPEDENSELLAVVPFQMLAYMTSVKKGNNPDRPRNLAKSVTVK